jgi:hypothetical protein
MPTRESEETMKDAKEQYLELTIEDEKRRLALADSMVRAAGGRPEDYPVEREPLVRRIAYFEKKLIEYRAMAAAVSIATPQRTTPANSGIYQVFAA